MPAETRACDEGGSSAAAPLGLPSMPRGGAAFCWAGAAGLRGGFGAGGSSCPWRPGLAALEPSRPGTGRLSGRFAAVDGTGLAPGNLRGLDAGGPPRAGGRRPDRLGRPLRDCPAPRRPRRTAAASGLGATPRSAAVRSMRSESALARLPSARACPTAPRGRGGAVRPGRLGGRARPLERGHAGRRGHAARVGAARGGERSRSELVDGDGRRRRRRPAPPASALTARPDAPAPAGRRRPRGRPRPGHRTGTRGARGPATPAAPADAALPVVESAVVSTLCFSAAVGITGSSRPIAARWRATSRSNAAHAGHSSTCRRIGARRSALPRSVAS